MALPIPEAEYQRRQAWLEEAMERLKIQGVIALGSHIFYLTGYPRFSEAVYLQTREGEKVLFSSMDEAYVKEEGWRIYCDKIVQVEDLAIRNRLGLDLEFKGLLKALKEFKGLRMGFAHGLYADQGLLEALKNYFGREGFLDCSESLWAVRRVKSLREREILKTAYYAVADSLNEGVKAVDEGVTRSELAGLIAENLYLHGVDGLSEGFSIGSGFNPSALSYPEGEEEGLRRGEVVTFNVGCRLYGYRAEASRSIILGDEGVPSLIEGLTLLYNSAEAALQAAASGEGLGEVCKASWRVFQERGWKERAWGHIHSIGIDGLEPPACRLDKPPANLNLHEGMILCLDVTVISKPGLGILRLKDGFLIHKDGAERLVTGVLSDPPKFRIRPKRLKANPT